MKTIVIYNEIESPLQFLIVEGDYSRFNGVIVNGVHGNVFEQEFVDWMFNPEDGERNHIGQWSEDTTILESKQWDKVALATWIP